MCRIRLYWSADGSTKLSGSTIFASVPVVSGTSSYSVAVPSGTVPPSGALSFVAITANNYGEMAHGIGTGADATAAPTACASPAQMLSRWR
jgi:hypothetical protein